MNALGIAFEASKDLKIKKKFEQLKKEIVVKRKNYRNLSVSQDP